MARATNGSSRQMPRFPCRGRRFGAENREEMISAVPLRLASRLDLAGLLRRDWRVAAMIGLLLLVPGAGIGEGQIARGERGLPPLNSSGVLLASGIKVDVTAKTSEHTRPPGCR